MLPYSTTRALHEERLRRFAAQADRAARGHKSRYVARGAAAVTSSVRQLATTVTKLGRSLGAGQNIRRERRPA